MLLCGSSVKMFIPNKLWVLKIDYIRQKFKTMNISKILLVFVLALSIVSCKKDDDGVIPFQFNQANLEGTYEVTYAVSTEVETINVNGFDVVTTTTNTGDTFGVEYAFGSNNMYTVNGAFRVTETVELGGMSNTTTDIIVIDNETYAFSVSSGSSLLTLDGDTYQVASFDETSMILTLEEIDTEANGDTTVYNEELRFTKI